MKRLLLSGLAVLAIISLTCCTDDDDTTQGRWYVKSDFDGPARSLACSFTIGEKGYLTTGFRGANKAYFNDLWVYDMNSNYWTQLSSLPDIIDGTAGGRYGGVGFAINGKGYITTGCTKDGSDHTFRADTWEYDPDTDTWTRMDDFPGVARVGAVAFTLGSYGYVGTGYNDDSDNDNTYRKDFYRFNPNAASGSQWTTLDGFPGKKRRYATAFVIDDEAYLCLGQSNNELCTDFYKFDGTDWTRLRDIADTNDDEDYDDDYAISRYGAVSFVIDGNGYIATGYRSGVSNDYWKYVPEKDLWYGDSDDDYTDLSDVYDAGSGGSSRVYAVSFSTGSRGFILTGESGDTYLDDMYELSPDEEQDV